MFTNSACYSAVLFISLIIATPVFSADIAEPPPVVKRSRKIAKDEGVAKVVAIPSAAKSPARKNLRRSEKSKAKLRSDDALTVQNSALANGATNTTGIPSATDTNAIAGSAGKAIARQSPAAATPVTMPVYTSEDSSMLPMLTQTMQSLANIYGGGRQLSKDEEEETAAETQARLITAAEQADGINRRLSDFGSISVPPPQECEICKGRRTTDPRFQDCDNQNGYLEDLLARTKNPSLDTSNVHPSNVSCIAASMRNLHTKRFLYCGNEHTSGTDTQVRACASEPLIKAVTSAMELTSDCLAKFVDSEAETNPKVKAGIRRAFFQLMNHESHFNMNAVSGTGAAGLGQFTKGAVKTYGDNSFETVMTEIKTSSNESCKQLAKMEYNKMNTGNCSAIAFENGNPQLNMMYTLMHMQDARIQSRIVLATSGLRMSSETTRSLLEKMSIWGHNVGVGGIRQILSDTLVLHGQLLEKGDKKSVELFLGRMMEQSMVYHRNAEPDRRNEATNFLNKTILDMKKTEGDTNGECGVY